MLQEPEQREPLVEMDVLNVESVDELHCRLRDALGFPDFYGKNWDAFWDSITGLITMPRRFIVYGWSNISTRWPDDAETMAECLRDMNALHPSNVCDYELRWGR